MSDEMRPRCPPRGPHARFTSAFCVLSLVQGSVQLLLLRARILESELGSTPRRHNQPLLVARDAPPERCSPSPRQRLRHPAPYRWAPGSDPTSLTDGFCPMLRRSPPPRGPYVRGMRQSDSYIRCGLCFGRGMPIVMLRLVSFHRGRVRTAVEGGTQDQPRALTRMA